LVPQPLAFFIYKNKKYPWIKKRICTGKNSKIYPY